MARGFNYAPGASAELVEAQQPGLHKTHLAALGASRNTLVRAAVAGRDDCPLGLMVTLAHDYSAEVRAAVAANPIAQRTVMAYLSADRNVGVVKALLGNPALTAEILEELAFHKKGEIRAAAAARLDLGLPTSEQAHAEDDHTPELAEHVAPAPGIPVLAPEPMTADGTVAIAFEPVNVVDIATGAPITAPHSTPEHQAPTRTAPVRGFKPRP